MGLVGYSDSEGSDAEEKSVVSNPSKAVQSTGRPAFQKVVDRSDPHKIRVNLPEPAYESVEDKQGEEEDEPPAKKARTGDGAFSGFNSFLPAPKRSAPLNGARRGGLGSGVNLKTGAAPGFSREPVTDLSQDAEQGPDIADGDGSLQENNRPSEDTNTERKDTVDILKPQSTESVYEEPKKKGNAMMFKPLSVARKPQKKKAIVANGETTLNLRDNPTSVQPKAAPKVSLFSAEPSQNIEKIKNSSSGAYEPLVYGATEAETPTTEASQIDNSYVENLEAPIDAVSQFSNAQGPQSLDAIASDLNLSASAKRQLFGRQKPNASAVNVVNFNTDQEYAANELLRQAGEQVQHNPIRAIAPGKHSLKQLINAASNQKDALEEQFASGRRNKKEAGSKYGW